MELYSEKSIRQKKVKKNAPALLSNSKFLKPFMTNINKQWAIMVRDFNYVDPHFKSFVCC